MTQTKRQRQPGLTRLVRDAGDELVARWRGVLGGEPLGGVRDLQMEVAAAVVGGTASRQLPAVRCLASRLGEREPELGELVHQLAALRQALDVLLSERLDPVAAADAHQRVNAAIDDLVEACTKSTTDRLTAAAFIDPLTGLRNRRALDRDLPERLALANRGNRPLTVVVGDLDGLKTINDRDGHAAGDQALRSLGDALQSALREGDTAYRIGGDEFLIVLPDTSAEEAATVVARVSRDAPSFGWGGATAPADGADGAALIELADERLLGRRNTRRTQVDQGPQGVGQPRRPRPRPRRALAAAALAAAGMFGGGVAFAAAAVIDPAYEQDGPRADRPATTATARPTAEARGSTVPDITESAVSAKGGATDGATSSRGTPTTTTTAGIIAALIEDAASEPPALQIQVADSDSPLPVPDAGTLFPIEPVEPTEVLGQVVVRGAESDPDSEAKAPKGPRASGKPHRP